MPNTSSITTAADLTNELNKMCDRLADGTISPKAVIAAATAAQATLKAWAVGIKYARTTGRVADIEALECFCGKKR